MNIIKARSELMQGKTIYDMNLRVADYGRVSTDKEDQLNSLENQINFFNDLIGSVKTWTHVNSYSDEGISGTRVYKREQFLKMIEDARLGKLDLIITKEVSRFARNTIDSIKYTKELLSYGVIVLFLSDNINTINPDSEFRLTLMASMAQDEVRKLSERVKFGIKRSIKDGKLGGSSIYGYTKQNGKLTINPKESPAVKKLFDLYLTGKYSFRKIASILASDGYLTRKGKIFSDITLKKMLTNPRYKGYYTANLSEVIDYQTHKKVYKPSSEWIIYKDKTGNIPSIISESIWNKANDLYQKRKKLPTKNILNKEEYLQNKYYTSKLICLEHQKPFIRCASGKRKEKPVWRCNEYVRHGLKGCLTPNLYEQHLNNIFVKVIKDILKDQTNLLTDILIDYSMILKEISPNKEILTNKIKEYEVLKDKLIDMFLNNLITDTEFKVKRQKLNQEIISLKDNTNNYDQNKLLPKIKKTLKAKMKMEDNIGKYFNLLIDKVYISKIDNNRNNLKLDINFRFNKEHLLVYYNKINFNNYKVII